MPDLIVLLAGGTLILVGLGLIAALARRPGVGDSGGELEDFPKSPEENDDVFTNGDGITRGGPDE